MGAAKTVTYLGAGSLGPGVKKATDYYIIFFGMAQASIGSDGNAREVMVDVREARSGNGEISVFSNAILSESIVSLERTLFAVVSQGDLRGWLLKSPGIKSSQL